MIIDRIATKSLLTFLILLSMTMTSCAPDALRGGTEAVEPMLIALRNSSGQRLDSMTVQETDRPIGEPMRLGSISPIMEGRTYTFRRRENPPRLPDDALVIYVHRRTGPQRITVRLREALKKSTGLPNEALIFDLQTTGQVRVYLDFIQP